MEGGVIIRLLWLIKESFLHPTLVLLNPYTLYMLCVFIGYEYFYVICCSSSEQLDEVGSIIIPILQIRKLTLVSDNQLGRF